MPSFAKSITYVNSAYTTDATYRTWGTAIKTAILASGLVQTSDTGQIDWTTVTKSTGALTVVGYEVYRFDDALQSTAPVFIKLGYIAGGNASGNNHYFSVRIGTGSNGAGTLTGTGSATAYNVGNTTTTTAASVTNQQIMTCHTSGSFTFLLEHYSIASATGPININISRTMNSSGTLTGEGLYLFGALGTTATPVGYHVAFNFNTGNVYGSTVQNANTYAPLDLQYISSGANYYVFPHYACIPHPVVVCGMVNNYTPATNGLGDGVEFPVSLNGGTARTYRVAYNSPVGTIRHAGANLTGGTSIGGITYEAYSLGTCYLWEA